MLLYEFTFIVHQCLLQQEVEDMIQELGLLLKNIKEEVLSRQLKQFMEIINLGITEKELGLCIKNAQLNLTSCSSFLEYFSKILWTKLEKDLSNLKEIELKISKEQKVNMKNLEIPEDFISVPKVDKQVDKGSFIRKRICFVREKISKYLVKFFQELLRNDIIRESGKLSKMLEILLINIEASGLIKHECWGVLDLAYPINKMKSAHYCLLCIGSTSTIMIEFIRRIKLNENIIRYLSVKVDKFFEGKSYMMSKQVEENI